MTNPRAEAEAIVNEVQVVVKTCTKCGLAKPVEAFSAKRAACKQCRAEEAAAYKAVHREAVLSAGRAHYQRNRDALCERQRVYRRENRPQLRAYFAQYRRERRDVIAPLQQKWNRANPEKRRAHSALWTAIQSGTVQRKDRCDNCGADGRIEAHHDDYAKPLDVRWLCGVCHEQADRERRSVERKAG